MKTKEERKAEKKLKKEAKLKKFLEKQKKQQIFVSKQTTIKQRKGGYNSYETEGQVLEQVISYEKNNKFTKTFMIAMPPPNITGNLHIGHGLMLTLQDIIIRYKKLLGYNTYYIPGLDHAGIATQTVIEKQLLKSKEKLNIKEKIERAYKWKHERSDYIYKQIKRLGVLANYNMDRFTLDKKYCESVSFAFIKLYEQGLIYRANRMVNWCAKLQTTLSDLEVDNKLIKPNTELEIENRKYIFGRMLYFKYPIIKKNEQIPNDLSGLKFLTVATTRPETILGDTAVCLSLGNNKYQEYNAINPLTREIIPIIESDKVDKDFGTGCMKVTPAHDFIDFEIGLSNKLKFIQVIDKNDNICYGNSIGINRFEYREKVIEILKEQDLFIKLEGYEMTLPICSRSGHILEPLLFKQWWMDCSDLAKKSLQALDNKEITFYPKGSDKHFRRWLENIRPWCLSRQLWWGHSIPAYRLFVNNERTGWIIANSKEEAMKQASMKYKSMKFEVIQDTDVLDTWFSSALWPFAILGWPENTNLVENLFPNDLLETGKDILFFWVARMVMFGIALVDQVPFKKVLLHGIVRDSEGRKMSKSLGNVIDPNDIIYGAKLDDLIKKITNSNLSTDEIQRASANIKKAHPAGIIECGADALRLGLAAYTMGTNDINLDIKRIEGYRRFCNKIWNVYKFITKINSEKVNIDSLSLNDDLFIIDWIKNNINNSSNIIINNINNYLFSEAIICYNKVFYEFCDFFIEITKTKMSKIFIQTANECFLHLLRLIHPFIPFITTEIYMKLTGTEIINETLECHYDFETNNYFDNIILLIKKIRSYDTKINLKVNKNIKHILTVFCKNLESVVYDEELKGENFDTLHFLFD